MLQDLTGGSPAVVIVVFVAVVWLLIRYNSEGSRNRKDSDDR